MAGVIMATGLFSRDLTMQQVDYAAISESWVLFGTLTTKVSEAPRPPKTTIKKINYLG